MGERSPGMCKFCEVKPYMGKRPYSKRPRRIVIIPRTGNIPVLNSHIYGSSKHYVFLCFECNSHMPALALKVLDTHVESRSAQAYRRAGRTLAVWPCLDRTHLFCSSDMNLSSDPAGTGATTGAVPFPVRPVTNLLNSLGHQTCCLAQVGTNV